MLKRKTANVPPERAAVTGTKLASFVVSAWSEASVSYVGMFRNYGAYPVIVEVRKLVKP